MFGIAVQIYQNLDVGFVWYCYTGMSSSRCLWCLVSLHRFVNMEMLVVSGSFVNKVIVSMVMVQMLGSGLFDASCFI